MSKQEPDAVQRAYEHGCEDGVAYAKESSGAMVVQKPGALVTSEVAAMLRPVVVEMMRGLSDSIADIKADIEENTRALKLAEVPLEAVKDSHERAQASFETLRTEIVAGGLDKLERVLDTAGLTDQASKAEQRFEALAARLEASIKSITDDMAAVLHLLERMQARALRDEKARAAKLERRRKAKRT